MTTPNLAEFIAAATLLAIIPGPGMIYVLTRTIAGGLPEHERRPACRLARNDARQKRRRIAGVLKLASSRLRDNTYWNGRFCSSARYTPMTLA